MHKLVGMVKAQFCGSGDRLDYRTWIFSSVDNCSFNYNSKYLFLYVRENCPDITPLFVINDERRRRALSEQYGGQYFVDSDSAEGMKRVLAAGVWFTSAGLPVYELTARPGRIVINLWHGIPLKRIVLLERHAGKLQRLYFRRIFSSKYTAILTTSEHLVPLMARSFGVRPEVVKVWGQPRNDAVLNGRPGEDLRNLLGIEGGRCVLYAPTYREGRATRLFPFPDYDREALEEFLEKQDCHICIRMHLNEPGGSGRYTGPHLHFINEDRIDDITEWMGCFDALITDYSSIYLDYLLLQRPVMFLPYDVEEYMRERGMNFSYHSVTPGPKPETQREFLEQLARLLSGKDTYGKRREKCGAYFNQIQKPCCGDICRHVRGLIEKRERKYHRRTGDEGRDKKDNL